MPKTTTRKAHPPQSLTRADVTELVQEIIREAIGTQARELETHLTSIHQRILKLETKR